MIARRPIRFLILTKHLWKKHGKKRVYQMFPMKVDSLKFYAIGSLRSSGIWCAVFFDILSTDVFQKITITVGSTCCSSGNFEEVCFILWQSCFRCSCWWCRRQFDQLVKLEPCCSINYNTYCLKGSNKTQIRDVSHKKKKVWNDTGRDTFDLSIC